MILLEELLNNLNKFCQNDVNHALSILLRVKYEIDYMNKKNINVNFVLNQMDNFEVQYTYNEIFVNIFGKNILIYNYSELIDLVEQIYKYFNEKYNINYDYKLLDPIYFSLFFYELLDKVLYYKYDYMYIDNFRLLRRNDNSVSLDESECFKMLTDRSREKTFKLFNSNHIVDTDRDRLYNSYSSVMNSNYGANNQFIILYNDEPYIRDGQHRASSLKYLYGNIKVKVVRFYLVNNYFYG